MARADAGFRLMPMAVPFSHLLWPAIAGVSLAIHCAAGENAAARTAELPRTYLATGPVAATGRAIRVPADGDLQAALDAAAPGQEILLQAGAEFSGPFILPVKPGNGWVTVRTDAPESSLPAPGQRINPSYRAVMARLTAATGPVISTARGAHHYRFIGIEIAPARGEQRPFRAALSRARIAAAVRGDTGRAEGAFLYNLVQLGDGEKSMAHLPHHFVFDRCYLHGDPELGTRRGIAMNSRHTAVINSYLSDFMEVGADSQAIAGWNGPGPFKIVNNYLEAAGENIMFGGADPAIPGLVPADIEIRRNHVSKPLSWKLDDPGYAGTPWSIKNLFELKNARRVVIDRNLFEFNWPHSQNGFAILFTVRNQNGTAPWSVVEDVNFSNNVVRHVANGINILGWDDIHASAQTRRILIRNNLFLDVGGTWGGGTFLQMLDGSANTVVADNTVVHTGNAVFGGDGRPHAGFVLSGNILMHNDYGIIGSGTGIGQPSLDRYFPAAKVDGNVLIGAPATLYPAGNFFPALTAEVMFRDESDGDFRLHPASPYRGAGADIDSLEAAFAAARGDGERMHGPRAAGQGRDGSRAPEQVEPRLVRAGSASRGP